MSFIAGLRVITDPNLPDGVIILHGGKCPACGGRGYIFSMQQVGGATACPGRHCWGGQLMMIVREGKTFADHQHQEEKVEGAEEEGVQEVGVVGVQKAAPSRASCGHVGNEPEHRWCYGSAKR